MQHPPFTDKNTIRKQMIDVRQRLQPPQRTAAGQAVAGWLTEYFATAGVTAAMVAGYVPIRGELDIMPAMTRLAASGHSLCLPVIAQKGHPLVFRQWSFEGALEKGAYGIDVPPEENAVVIPNIVLVPLVAFDRHGYRLGYGGGYYDRTIAGLREQNKSLKLLGPLTLIGMGYGLQEVERLVVEPHDQRLDAVITEQGIIQDYEAIILR